MLGNLLFLLYNILTPFIALIYLLYFFLLPRRKLLKKLPMELKERFGLSLPKDLLKKNCIWLHAASVGEVKSLAKIVEKLEKINPEGAILITTSTSAGKKEALKFNRNSILAPFDFYPVVLNFIHRLKPKFLLITETEIWPNMLEIAYKNHVRIFIINGKISKKTYIFYRFLKPLITKILKNVSHIFCQTKSDAHKFKTFLQDTNKITVTGNIKYDIIDRNLDKLPEINLFLKKLNWQKSKIWTAGSTRTGEAEIIAEAYLISKKENANLKLVIVPRHQERVKYTSNVLNQKGIKFLIWSERNSKQFFPDIDCILVDEMGWLNGFYYVSFACFVGGTLVKKGGHNLLEPSLFSKPVLFGPHLESVKKVSRILRKFGGGILVNSHQELSEKINLLLKEQNLLKTTGENSYRAFKSLQGATEKTLSGIFK